MDKCPCLSPINTPFERIIAENAATEYDDKADNAKASLLLHCIDDKAREIYDTLTFDADDDNMKLDKILENFEAYLAPRKNVTYSRYKFFTYRQEEGISSNKYLPEFSS